jgi:hypothetical protein
MSLGLPAFFSLLCPLLRGEGWALKDSTPYAWLIYLAISWEFCWADVGEWGF